MGICNQSNVANLLDEGTIVTGPIAMGNGNLKFRLINGELETPLSQAEELLFGVLRTMTGDIEVRSMTQHRRRAGHLILRLQRP